MKGKPRVFKYNGDWAVEYPPANTITAQRGSLCPVFDTWERAMLSAACWWKTYKDVRTA